jgi:hypothetical protein
LKTLSKIFAKTLGFFVPALVGATFFFFIIGVFGLESAITGVLLTVIGAVIIVRRLPAEGDAR